MQYPLLELFIRHVKFLSGVDLEEVMFGSPKLAMFGVIALVIAILIKRAVRSPRTRRQSGHSYTKRRWYAFIGKTAKTVALACFIPAAFFLLVAAADPYIKRGVYEQRIPYREVCYVIDASGSMAFPFAGTNRSLAEVIWTSLYKTLAKRIGKNDRACLFIFSDSPHKIEDFITDGTVFLMRAFDAPWIAVGRLHPLLVLRGKVPGATVDSLEGMAFGDSPIPTGRIGIVGEGISGGTNLVRVLDALHLYLTSGGASDTLERGVVVITDAAVNKVPRAQLEKLKQARVMSFLVVVEPNREKIALAGGGDSQLPNIDSMRVAIGEYGGEYFEIRQEKEGETALMKVLERIDRKLPEYDILVTTRAERISLRPHALLISFAFLCFGCFIGILVEVEYGYNT
ncbi:MAG: hypothetical protein A2939_01200 [Parcubacteria group bacterium RIFCSPLOWO2_01_FULL_48_18]|nr:MAG: hypothetical protein A3J67_00110 [Parcubacteria group bacterium RIFCSPHIGHO2_02_FULL_48_10b]OHB21868.1 MAG: hypothetical protein A2939_01200 [Parcubacteria group bacterium RIFCSPLOWO2_01_FULL_48_18]